MVDWSATRSLPKALARGHIRAYPYVGLVDDLASGEDTHEGVRELVGGGVRDGLLGDQHVRKGF